MIARVGNGAPRVGITGIGAYAPERVLTNADLVKMVDRRGRPHVGIGARRLGRRKVRVRG